MISASSVRFFQFCCQTCLTVCTMRHRFRLHSKLTKPGRNHHPIGIIDFSRFQRISRLAEFISCGKHADHRFPVNSHLCTPDTGQDPLLCKSNSGTFCQKKRILFIIFALKAIIVPWLLTFINFLQFLPRSLYPPALPQYLPLPEKELLS